MFGTLAEKIEAKNIPVSCSFELTWQCNLDCRFCYQYRKDANELNLDEIKGILSELASLGCLFLSFTGGEPLLRRDFWEIAQYAKSRNFALTLQTNGTLITQDFAVRIKQLNFFEVHISLLGAKAQTHDWLTQRTGSFDKAIKAIELLRAQDVRVNLKTTVVKQNFSELEDIDRIAARFRCQQVKVPVVSARNSGDKAPCDYRIDDFQMKNFYSDIFKRNPKQRKDYESYAGEEMVTCRAARTGFSISPVGEIYPCVGLPVPVGSLRQNSFSQIWNTSDFIRQIREVKLDDLAQCSKCDLLPICMRCMGMAYIEDGGILAPSKEACRIANIVKEVMKGEEEKV